jgi:hypothetical protein
MLAAPTIIDRTKTYNGAGVSGNGSIIIPRWWPKRKGHLSLRSKANIYHLPPS